MDNPEDRDRWIRPVPADVRVRIVCPTCSGHGAVLREGGAVVGDVLDGVEVGNLPDGAEVRHVPVDNPQWMTARKVDGRWAFIFPSGDLTRKPHSTLPGGGFRDERWCVTALPAVS